MPVIDKYGRNHLISLLINHNSSTFSYDLFGNPMSFQSILFTVKIMWNVWCCTIIWVPHSEITANQAIQL